jgi:putative transposase
LKEAGFFLMKCSIIDVFDRQIVGHYCGRTCKSEDVTRMMMKAILRRKVHWKPGHGEAKLIIRTDNGPQFISHLFAKYCAFHGVYHERIPNASPNMNAYIESYHSQLQRECIDRHEMESYDHAEYYINDYVKFYNERRPHGSLGYLSPQKFIEAVNNGHETISISL